MRVAGRAPAGTGHEPRRPSRRRNAALGLAALASALLAPAALAQEALPRQVSAYVATRGAVTATRTASVTVEPARDAMVAAGVSGQVARVLVRDGGAVAEGQVVIQIDDANLRLQVENARIAVESARINLSAAERASQEGAGQAQAALQAAEASLELARRQLEEARQLHAAGAVAATELAALEAQYAQAQSAVQQARDAVARSGRVDAEELELRRLQVRQAENQLAQAQRALADAQVRAPFAGTVAQVLYEEGEFLPAGSPAFRLVDDQTQLARFSVPPQDAQALLASGLVHVPYGGLDYAAQVSGSSAVPGQARLVDMTAVIYPSRTRIPNGTVTTMPYEVPLAEGVVVPVSALRYAAGEARVFVVEEGVARERRVVVLAEGAGRAVVEGVAEGELVIDPLPADLLAGSPVTVLNEVGRQ